MPFVGLTGGMGAGKSTALAALERLGAAVLSSDAVVHELYAGDGSCATRWSRAGAPEVAPGGVVDRSAVAERAFASAEERAWLEGLLWPLVGARVAAWLAEVRAGRGRPRAARGRGRGAAAVRGGPGGDLRRDDRGGRRRAAARASAPPRAGTRWPTSARRASSRRRRRRAGRRSSCATTAASRSCERELSAVLDKLGG